MTQHIVSSFDTELDSLRARIAEMGGIAEKMLEDSVRALTRQDVELAQKVIAHDKKLDALQREIEEQAILIIARRQPMAVDLREVIAALRIASDIERIGDMAKNIGKRGIAISSQFHPQKTMNGIETMRDLAAGQLRDVLDAYTHKDEARARDVWQRDGAIDDLYTSLFREFLTYMMEDPRSITYGIHLLFCAKNIERIGDHTTNIAETVFYQVTGHSLPTDRPKGEAMIGTGG
jgi:phosphate transport system protein